MGVFGAVFGCSGDAGFSGSLLGVSSGVVGFNASALSRRVREKVLPAWSDGGSERDNVRPARSRWPKFGVFALAGRVFSRRCRWRGCAGRASSRQLALCRSWMRCGALQGGCGWGFCAMRSPLAACRRRVGGLDGVIPPCGGEATSRGGVAAKVQTHWAKNAENRLFEVNGSALWRIWRVWTHRLRYSALQAR